MQLQHIAQGLEEPALPRKGLDLVDVGAEPLHALAEGDHQPAHDAEPRGEAGLGEGVGARRLLEVEGVRQVGPGLARGLLLEEQRVDLSGGAGEVTWSGEVELSN